MTHFRHSIFTGALIAGSLASFLSTAALMQAGARRARALAPVNAISHWYWGDSALHRTRADLGHTLLGYVTHHVASVFWSTLLMHRLHRASAPPTAARIAAASAGTGALACVVDFKFTPERFTPGFEHEIGKPALAGVYVAFAAGMALGALLLRAPEGSEDGGNAA
ncbi:hypothetical protein [Comamonas endophytica]|uniref:Uncharacterized protein n=1 Tax=Comamonas endophytica TaxID=2949090 RepID=A0ABY6GFA4_9BURK|nr:MULTISPECIES: hypothetical protein [unclassified Acidovorax]MCD2514334.1 hypothetical protein [Acidovorax sp. D4N7]UYG53583.1 hypothetical protein M9799_19665 [Acidovorax sp. 5MLIR]UYG53627.1 hypothetical protein M9799_16925 [Acidovorax sp. 5MLIR]